MRVDFSPEALDDLDAIFDQIARSNAAAARRWIDHLIARATRAAEHPLAGRMVPEVGQTSIREILVKNYRVVYRVEKRRILVVTVIEGHRRLQRQRARTPRSKL